MEAIALHFLHHQPDDTMLYASRLEERAEGPQGSMVVRYYEPKGLWGRGYPPSKKFEYLDTFP